jgi:hypothetical protein
MRLLSTGCDGCVRLVGMSKLIEDKRSTHVSTSNDSKELLNASQRRGELVGVAAILFVFAFFAYHELANTGFYTSSFGGLEMILLYGSILFSALAPFTRALTGRTNLARPVEAASNIFFEATQIWLLIVFPFNFSHLPAALPSQLGFLLSWITNDVGRILLVLGIIGIPVFASINIRKYLSLRQGEAINRPLSSSAFP